MTLPIPLDPFASDHREGRSRRDLRQRSGLASRLAGVLVLVLVTVGAGCSSPAERLYEVGEKSLGAGDAVQAVIAFKHARELAPTEFKYHQAVWRAAARFLAEGLEHVTIENQEESRFELEQLLAAEPKSPIYLTALAHVLEHDGKRAEAGKKLDEAVKADPKSVVAHVARGAFLQRSGGRTDQAIDEAVAEYQAALASDPSSLAAHLGLGRLYVSKKDSAKEIDELSKAVAIDPASYQASEWLGDAYLHAGKLVDAFKAYNRAALLQPRNPEPHWGLGMIKSQAGKWAEAEQELRLAMKGQRFPEMDFQLAQAIARQPGRCTEAIPLFQMFLREQPDHPAALFELASCETLLDRKSDAVGYLKRLIALPIPAEDDPRREDAVKRLRAAQTNLAMLQASMAAPAPAPAPAKKK